MFNIAGQSLKAIELLEKAGFGAWLVGGCVRDLTMGKAPHDWDMTTTALPEEMKAVFSDYRLIETGLKHGTLTVIIDGVPLEITTCRIDGEYLDNRRPGSVAFTDKLEEDLKRRDFTINAMAYSPKKGITDLFGGREDLENGIIRCVGRAEERFREDGLRILRALRFASVLGFRLEEKTAAAVHSERELLLNISAERLYSELTKLLCGKNAREILEGYSDVFCTIMPELKPMVGFEQHNKYHCYDVWGHTAAAVESIAPEPYLRWAALLHDTGKPACFFIGEDKAGHFYGHPKKSAELAEKILRRLKAENAAVSRIVTLVENHDIQTQPVKKIIKRRLNKYGEEVFFELISLFRADNLAQAPEYRFRQKEFDELEAMAREIIADDECFSLKALAVKGGDLAALGFKGEEIGRMLNKLLEAVINEKIANDREALLKTAEVRLNKKKEKQQ